jgi:NADPH:quinone reductase-like Zn-dependent oxidoreductase
VKAAVRDRYGGADVVRVDEIDTPIPGDGEILVRVHAASVNRADLDQIHPRPGFLRLFLGVRRPRNIRLGSDVAGVVEAIGPNVTRFRPGDRVFADLFSAGQGSFAELVSAPEKAFLPIPDGLGFETAATLPHSAILALQGLRDRRGRSVSRGARVLIGGASGNVGPFAVQIAKSMGAEVTAVCSTRNLELVRSLGADLAIDYTQENFTDRVAQYDMILDNVSTQSLSDMRRVLKPEGRLVIVGGTSRDPWIGPLWPAVKAYFMSHFVDQPMGLFISQSNPADLAALAELLREGKMKTVIDRRYPLSETAAAIEYLETGRARGKVIVTMDQDSTSSDLTRRRTARLE